MSKLFGFLALMSYYLAPDSVSPMNKTYTDKVIKEVNRNGPYIGLVSVLSPEEVDLFSSGTFRPDPSTPFVDLSGRRFWVGQVSGRRVIFVKCGKGLINAATTTQQLLDRFDIGGIIHFGIAGNLNNSLSIGDVTIPKAFINSGIWDLLNPHYTTADSGYIAGLAVKDYNRPKIGNNELGNIGFNSERLYSDSGEPDTYKKIVWAPVDHKWLRAATKIEGLKLKQCVNASYCLDERPKVVVGLRGSTSNIYVDNAAYRDFLFDTFEVSSADMESSAVVMTCLSNDYPVIVVRGLSNLAGKGGNDGAIYKSLAVSNTAKAVIHLLRELPVGDEF